MAPGGPAHKCERGHEDNPQEIRTEGGGPPGHQKLDTGLSQAVPP